MWNNAFISEQSARADSQALGQVWAFVAELFLLWPQQLEPGGFVLNSDRGNT